MTSDLQEAPNSTKKEPRKKKFKARSKVTMKKRSKNYATTHNEATAKSTDLRNKSTEWLLPSSSRDKRINQKGRYPKTNDHNKTKKKTN